MSPPLAPVSTSLTSVKFFASMIRSGSAAVPAPAA